MTHWNDISKSSCSEALQLNAHVPGSVSLMTTLSSNLSQPVRAKRATSHIIRYLFNIPSSYKLIVRVKILCKDTNYFTNNAYLCRKFQKTMHQSDSIVIIPTYNEKENIEKIIRAVFGLEKCFHILVIDDGSPDGTAQIVKRLMADEFSDRLFIVERSGKLGLGTAYITGFKWALERDYGYIFEMDADFSHDPNDLPRLYSACADEGYDLAIGSRYVSGVNVVNWPIGRVLMSYFASKYVRMVTGFKVHDTTAGFKCYKRRVLQTIELDKIRFKGYGFQIEMKFTAYKIGFKIKEVPVIFVNRREGTSKMSGGIFGEAFFGVMRLRWDGWTRKYPKIVED